jgi:hypothetical protein
MGSLQSDGSPIQQSRSSIRQLGKAFTESADRVELRTEVHGSGVLGPQLSVDGTQIATLKVYEGIKITRSTDDTTLRFVAVSGLADL